MGEEKLMQELVRDALRQFVATRLNAREIATIGETGLICLSAGKSTRTQIKLNVEYLRAMPLSACIGAAGIMRVKDEKGATHAYGVERSSHPLVLKSANALADLERSIGTLSAILRLDMTTRHTAEKWTNLVLQTQKLKIGE